MVLRIPNFYRVQLHYISALCFPDLLYYIYEDLSYCSKTFILILLLLCMLIMNMLSGNTKLVAKSHPQMGSSYDYS